jgi:hypothetical protein
MNVFLTHRRSIKTSTSDSSIVDTYSIPVLPLGVSLRPGNTKTTRNRLERSSPNLRETSCVPPNPSSNSEKGLPLPRKNATVLGILGTITEKCSNWFSYSITHVEALPRDSPLPFRFHHLHRGLRSHFRSSQINVAIPTSPNSGSTRKQPSRAEL